MGPYLLPELPGPGRLGLHGQLHGQLQGPLKQCEARVLLRLLSRGPGPTPGPSTTLFPPSRDVFQNYRRPKAALYTPATTLNPSP